MPAKKGNKYAEKWTKTEVLAMLAKIEKEAKKPSCLWLGSALVKVGLYKDIWVYWSEKFRSDQDVFRTIKRIDQIFEDRLYSRAAKGDINATMAVFGLKNNHYWTDRRELDHTTAGHPMSGLKIEIVNATDPVTREDEIDEDI